MPSPKYGNYFHLDGIDREGIPAATRRAWNEIKLSVPPKLRQRTVFYIILPCQYYDWLGERGYLCWKVIDSDKPMPTKRFMIEGIEGCNHKY